MEGPFYLATLTFLPMLLAVYWHRVQRFHVSVMLSIIAFDIGMPFYLMMTRNWNKRLLEDGDILSFGVWMHFGLNIALFVLYAIQVQAGFRLLKKPKNNSEEIQREHRLLAKGVLFVRALVIASGAMLSEPETMT
jgi:hypothetical protein